MRFLEQFTGVYSVFLLLPLVFVWRTFIYLKSMVGCVRLLSICSQRWHFLFCTRV